MHRKKLAVLAMAALMTFSNTGMTATVFAEEPAQETNMSAAEEQPAPQPETPAPQPETPAPQPETPAPQPETPAPQSETPAPQPETPAPQPETPAPQPETQAPTAETAVPQATASETAVNQEKTTEAGTEAGTETATEGLAQNHSTAIPENPKEKRQNVNIVDAHEEEEEDEEEAQRKAAKEACPYKSDAQLLAAVSIGHYDDFSGIGFEHVSVPNSHFTSKASVYEEADKESKVVGEALRNDICTVLEEGDGWSYIESGETRGYVESSALSKGSGNGYGTYATATVPWYENGAFLHTMTTGRRVSAERKIIRAKSDIYIYEKPSTVSKKVGKLSENSFGYFLEQSEVNPGMYYIESGDVRGFVLRDKTGSGNGAERKMDKADIISFAESLVDQNTNAAYYHTMTSVQQDDPYRNMRQKVLEYANGFVGNPYVWGGTSLTAGCDCSGFVQSVYANFGYSLPRVACDQAMTGKKIPASEAKAGDLVFYSDEGYIYHVAMADGNGGTVQAKGKAFGIVNNEPVGNAIWAVCVFGD